MLQLTHNDKGQSDVSVAPVCQNANQVEEKNELPIR